MMALQNKLEELDALYLLGKRFNNRAINQVVASLLLVVTLVAMAIIVYVFSVGLLGGGFSNTGQVGLQTSIIPVIYSRDANVATLNDTANFTIAVSSSVSNAQDIVVNLTAGRSVVQSVAFYLRPGETRTKLISQTLNSTGLWTVKATANGKPLGSYSFEVTATRDEADYKIRQWRDLQFYRTMVLVSLGGAATSLIVSVASLARRR